MTGVKFEFVEHTADIAVRLSAPSVGGLFEAAAAALTETVTDRGAIREVESRDIRLEAAEPDLLLVDWLNELLFLFETERLLVARAAVSLDAEAALRLDARGVSLRAGVHGERHDPARHALKVLVKAVTYHGLAIERAAEGYVATVIFDI